MTPPWTREQGEGFPEINIALLLCRARWDSAGFCYRLKIWLTCICKDKVMCTLHFVFSGTAKGWLWTGCSRILLGVIHRKSIPFSRMTLNGNFSGDLDQCRGPRGYSRATSAWERQEAAMRITFKEFYWSAGLSLNNPTLGSFAPLTVPPWPHHVIVTDKQEVWMHRCVPPKVQAASGCSQLSGSPAACFFLYKQEVITFFWHSAQMCKWDLCQCSKDAGIPHLVLCPLRHLSPISGVLHETQVCLSLRTQPPVAVSGLSYSPRHTDGTTSGNDRSFWKGVNPCLRVAIFPANPPLPPRVGGWT